MTHHRPSRWSTRKLAGLAILACLSAIASSPLQAQQATIFPFLRGNISARAAGLGGSTVAMPKDLGMVVLNPAGLTTLEDRTVTATFIKHVLDINSGYAAFGDNIEDLGSYAITASYTSYGSFERTDANGQANGTFGASDVAIAASFARELDTLISWGASLKFLHGSIESQTTTALAVDAGLLIQIPASRTNVGLAILNAGVQLSTYDGVADRLPIDVRAGVNHRLKGLPLLVNFSINHLADEVDSFFDRFLNFSVGGELSIGKYVLARVGYDNATRNLSEVNVATQLSGLSGGLGVYLEHLRFDYAFSTMGSSAYLHRLSVGLDL
jgi:hypothetical protein